MFELKDKFHAIIKQDSEKKNEIRDLSPYITEKCNGFNLARLEFAKKLRQEISPIDIIYKLVKKDTENIEYFFSNKINIAYRTTFSENKKLRHGTAFQ